MRATHTKKHKEKGGHISHAGNEELKEKVYEDLYEELGREPTQEEVQKELEGRE